ncbi:hypothetical protein T439DRAFT_323593 [Meredithblackwellia eburnea MCA 4105]
MSSTRLVAVAIIAVPPLILLQQHLRLSSLYPTEMVTSALEISKRKDKPAIGMGPDKSRFLTTHAGDEWSVLVPRRLVSDNNGTPPETIFARAYWDSWPLALEHRIMNVLFATGLGPFKARKSAGSSEHEIEEERKFTPGTAVLGGLFATEAHDEHPTLNSSEVSSIAGPIVTSWWLAPVDQKPSLRMGLMGGYHSFAVESVPPPEVSSSTSASEEMVRLAFTSHLILSSPPPNFDPAGPTSPTDELQGLSTKQYIVMKFHTFYSRILLDCAVRGLWTRKE